VKSKNKSPGGFGKWTFINVQKRKPEKSFEKNLFFRVLDHYDVKYIKIDFQNVIVFF